MTDIEEKIAKAEEEIPAVTEQKAETSQIRKKTQNARRGHTALLSVEHTGKPVGEAGAVQQRADKGLVGGYFSDRTGAGAFTENRRRKPGELNLPCLTRAHLYTLTVCALCRGLISAFR